MENHIFCHGSMHATENSNNVSKEGIFVALDLYCGQVGKIGTLLNILCSRTFSHVQCHTVFQMQLDGF